MAALQAPLAERLRPRTLDEVAGQRHLLGEGAVFRRTVEGGLVPNMIFYGPSGCGKTTVARIIAEASGKKLHKLNGTQASTGDIRDVVRDAFGFEGQRGVLLYLDEIQYLNKKQQQSLLEFIEDGSVTLIASTTENPFFYIYNALLSRCTVFEFKALETADVEAGLLKALGRMQELDGVRVAPEEGALRKLALAANGDMRKALNMLEFAVAAAPDQKEEAEGGPAQKAGARRRGLKSGEAAEALPAGAAPTRLLTCAAVAQVAGAGGMRYDRSGDEHYDILSAYQKSMRGSDADAALHYLARLLEAGDLISACRRLLVTAAEDVGLAYPQILPIVKAAADMATQIGLPEATIPLADAVVLVCLAPKSNTGAMAGFAARADVEKGLGGAIPRQLQNKHFDGADAEAKGQHYQYAHNFENHWVAQQYLPDDLRGAQYYTYGDNKTEQAFKAYWDKVKGEGK